MYSLSEIRQLHIEPTTRCNAECPMCARNFKGRVAPGLVEDSMTLETFAHATPATLIRQLDLIDVCGAYGDPVLTPDLLQMCTHVRRLNEMCEIRIFTNGGVRDAGWWSRLGRITGVVTIFAIDGLATNDVYRRRVKLDRALRNAKAFIDAGGHAQWDYIVFAHNEHEMEDARRLSETMSFQRFAVKRTARFLRPLYESADEMPEPKSIESYPIYDRSGRITGQLRPPAARHRVNEALLWAREVADKATHLESLFDTCPVKCSVLNSRSIFMSAAAHVYPCCWVYVQATLPVLLRGVGATDPQVRRLLEANGGEATLDATSRPLDEILNSPFFAAIERSWSAPSVAAGRLKVCARVCGGGFNAVQKQWERPDLMPWQDAPR